MSSSVHSQGTKKAQNPFFFSTEEHQTDIYLPLGRDVIESILIHKYLACFSSKAS